MEHLLGPRVIAVFATGMIAGCGGTTATKQPTTTSANVESETAAATKASTANPPLTNVTQLAADTPVSFASSANVVVPSGWMIAAKTPQLLHIVGPERDVDLFFVDGVEVSTQAEAIAAAWAKVPGKPTEIADQADEPGRDGWDASAQVMYVTPTQQSRSVVAVARRSGSKWYVQIIQGKNAGLERRSAQMNTMLESFTVSGVAKESFAGKTAIINADNLASFGAFVDQARALANIPGVAIAVVQGDKIIFEKGYGVRALSGKSKVTPNTKFMIGSTTKSLTTLMMARLVDAKTFDWTTPITKLMPTFALGDAKTTAIANMQHTVCACTGMPRRDLEFIFEYDNVSAESRIASMKNMVPSTGFGETFQYSNLMVAAGGYIAASAAAPGKALDAAYDAVMQREVIGPLGMKSTTFDMKAAQLGDFAMPHGQQLTTEMAYQQIPLHTEDAVVAVKPAGGAWSTVRDLARYVSLELGKGKLGGKQLLSTEVMKHRSTKQVKISDTDAYGLGLFVSEDNGVLTIGHGGNTIGFTSDLFFLPEQNVGVIVLTNAGGANGFRSAVKRRFMELIFDGKSEAKENLVEGIARAKGDIKESLARIEMAPKPAWISPLLGTYGNADLGQIVLRKSNDGYVLDAGEWQTKVAQLHDRDGSEKLVTVSPPFAGLDMLPTAGSKDSPASLALDAGQQVYKFVRKE
jgi:CubicO group peptidase (beta-lactamase class C family)